MDPLNSTINALSNPQLFTNGNTLKVVGTGKDQGLSIVRLNIIQRIIAWLGFGNSSTKSIETFFQTNHGQDHVTAGLKSEHQVIILKNLETLQNKVDSQI